MTIVPANVPTSSSGELTVSLVKSVLRGGAQVMAGSGVRSGNASPTEAFGIVHVGSSPEHIYHNIGSR